MQEPDRQAAERRLARTGFPDKAQNLAFTQVEAGIRNGVHDTAGAPKPSAAAGERLADAVDPKHLINLNCPQVQGERFAHRFLSITASPSHHQPVGVEDPRPSNRLRSQEPDYK